MIAAFVFLGSEGTVDAPRITGVDTGKPPPASKSAAAPAKPEPAAKPKPTPKPAPHPIPTVEIVGGAPPEAAGPAKLRFKRGQRVRFKVETNEPVTIEIPGYGIAETVESGDLVSFPARHTGQFPVIAAATHIGVADLWVRP